MPGTTAPRERNWRVMVGTFLADTDALTWTRSGGIEFIVVKLKPCLTSAMGFNEASWNAPASMETLYSTSDHLCDDV